MDESAHLRGLLTQLNTLGVRAGHRSSRHPNYDALRTPHVRRSDMTYQEKTAHDRAQAITLRALKQEERNASQHNGRQTRENKPRRSPWNTNREPSADTIEREWDAFDPYAHVPFPPLTPQKPKKLNRQRASGFPETDEERRAMERATTFESNLYDKHLHEERTAALRRRQNEEDDHYKALQARSGAATGPRRY